MPIVAVLRIPGGQVRMRQDLFDRVCPDETRGQAEITAACDQNKRLVDPGKCSGGKFT